MISYLGNQAEEQLLLVANNLTSAVMVVACWWLAHQYARIRPPGRAIAIAFAALGLSVLFTMVGRNMGLSVQWPIVISKCLLGLGLCLVAYRRHQADRAEIRAGAADD